jgi:hypothetical protein
LTDRIDALASDRAALWDRVSNAPFLTLNEKREAVGCGPVAAGIGGSERHFSGAVILRCSPFFGASLEGCGHRCMRPILRDAAQARGSSRDNGEAVTRG